MDCAECLKRKNVEFEKKAHLFENRHHLAIFLLNTILNIQNEWSGFCQCKRNEIWLVCQAKSCYQNFQYKIYEHSLDLNFLAKYRENLYRNMLKLITLDNQFICRIINKKYKYFRRDWFTGEKNEYYAELCLEIYEQLKINRIISNDCKVVLESI